MKKKIVSFAIICICLFACFAAAVSAASEAAEPASTNDVTAYGTAELHAAVSGLENAALSNGKFVFGISSDNELEGTFEAVYYSEKGEQLRSVKTEIPSDIEFAEGEYVVITLPVGRYTVEFDSTYSELDCIDKKASVTVVEGKNSVISADFEVSVAKGSFRLSTDIKNETSADFPSDAVFEFEVDGDGNDAEVSVYNSKNEIVDSYNAVLPFDIALKYGEYAVVCAEEGNYVVTQRVNSDFAVTEKQKTVAVSSNEKNVVFENTYIEPAGILELGVDVVYPSGITAPENEVFKFKVTGECTETVVEYTVYDADGEQVGKGDIAFPSVIALAEGERAWLKLPAGITYTVTLEAADDYDTPELLKTVTVVKRENVEAVFSSTYINPVGVLILDVVVVEPDDATAPDDVFEFSISGDPENDRVEYVLYDDDGTVVARKSATLPISIRMKASQYAEFELYPGNYTVTQTEIENYDITEKWNFNIGKRRETTVEIINEYIEPLGSVVVERSGLGIDESFVFVIKGIDTGNRHIAFTVIVPANKDKVVVRDLPIGRYEVSFDSDWSVRYETSVNGVANSRASVVKVELDGMGDVASAEFETVYADKPYWLIGEAYIEKKYYIN